MKNSKKVISKILLIILLILIIQLVPIENVKATKEEGKFIYNTEWKYNIRLINALSGYFLDEDGYIWKYETYGIKKISESKFIDFSVGNGHYLAIDEEGYMWSWGNNEYGQLGIGNTQDCDTPVTVLPTKKFKKVYAGQGCSYAIDESGYVYGWGSNKDNNVFSTNAKVLTYCEHHVGYGDLQIPIQTVPHKITELGNVKIKDISVKRYATGYYGINVLAIDEDGYVWGWGRNNHLIGDYPDNIKTMRYYIYKNGEINPYDSYEEVKVLVKPVKIKDTKQFKDISVGGRQSVLLDTEGHVYVRGYQTNGILGNGETEATLIDRWITPIGLANTVIVDVCAGMESTAFISEDGNIYTCGKNNYGQLGNGTTNNASTIVRVTKDSNIKFVKFGSDNSSYTVYAIDQNENLWGWGYNEEGQIGIGNKTSYEKKPVQITEYKTSYTVTFMNGTEVVETQTVETGSAATAPTLTREGYTLSWDTDFSNVTSDLTVKAIWTANTNTPYKVEHYKRNLDAEVVGYDLFETENLSGTTDALALAVAKTYEGFTENTTYESRIERGNIAADGSLVLKLYYDRNNYNIAYNLNGGTATSTLTPTYVYGKELILSNKVEKQGYAFAGWYDNSSLTGTAVTSISATETGDKTFYAKWTTNTDTAYKVEHYKQNTTLDGYELVTQDTESLTGTTDTTVTATAKTYTGFTENTTYSGRVASGNIVADGSLILKLYYDRNTYTITLNTNDGTINSGNATSYTYGIGANLPTDVTKTGYIFAGWYEDGSFSGSSVTSISTTDIGNKEYFAKWTINQYTVAFKNGDTIEKTETVNHGSNATAPSLTKAGYTLSWDTDFSNITSDLTVNAIWTANRNTPYRVEHYKRNLDTEVVGYDLFETENLSGTTDTTVTAIAKTYTGFTENTAHESRVETGTIAGDGSLVLKLYYDRNSYNITYELNGGTAKGTLTKSYTYGKEIILSSKVEKQGYVFGGWYDNSGLTGTAVTAISATETGDKTFYAKWISDDQYSIISEKYNIDVQENYITKVSPNTNVQALISNLNTNGTAKVLNAKGEELAKDALVGTGCKVQVDYKGTKYEYEVAVRGDIDGNGKITVTDLSMLNQVLVKKLTVTGAKEKATDIDYSKKITVTDLSMMNQALVGKINL